jgi:hypothetical protein
MIKLIDLIKEAKQVGTLYHFTDYCSMFEIVESDMSMYSEFERISFTRYKNFNAPDISKEVRIAVDGTKLSNKYKIAPYSSSTAAFSRSAHSGKEEAEEFLDIGEGQLDLSEYLIGIEVIDLDVLNTTDTDAYFTKSKKESARCYKKLLKVLKKDEIPYKLVNRFS